MKHNLFKKYTFQRNITSYFPQELIPTIWKHTITGTKQSIFLSLQSNIIRIFHLFRINFYGACSVQVLTEVCPVKGRTKYVGQNGCLQESHNISRQSVPDYCSDLPHHYEVNKSMNRSFLSSGNDNVMLLLICRLRNFTRSETCRAGHMPLHMPIKS